MSSVLREVDRLTHAGRWAFGFVAYEAAGAFDPGLVTHRPADDLPLAWFAITDAPRTVPVVAPGVGPARAGGPWRCEMTDVEHARAVGAVHAHIARGETYQCNLTTRLLGPAPSDPGRLYRAIAIAQRGAHNSYLDTGRFVLASASPELFFARSGDRITMRPMKGTAPRGRTMAEDRELVERLCGSEKERAENIMIVDLVRNDLARISRTGTVTVRRLLAVERYETVHQLTSDVVADLHPGTDLNAVFGALFPCGSVTGAPKARTMQLIHDTEPSPRGVYCGAIGVVAPPDAPVRARFSVAIRTVLVDRHAGAATYGAGGGVTWTSTPAGEYAELQAKTRVLDDRNHVEDFHLIETLRYTAEGGLRSFEAHIARAEDSAAFFGFRFDARAIRDAVRRRVAGRSAGRVRIRCHRSGRIVVDVEPLPASDHTPRQVVVDPDPVDTSQCWPFHKTSRREPYTSRMARHPRADDVLLINERGELTESCTANLVVELDGTWCTPPATAGCLPGVERRRLLEDGTIHERILWPSDLDRADGLALVSSLRGWRSAVLQDDKPKVTAVATVPESGLVVESRLLSGETP
ncbi:chorismate-binding protein [Pseudonocardia alni]|uniref:chorismate-binding protein n=1 Tax=Pseudonocardia alni TaxID=33907 RepID=UPI00280BB5CA|nr:chorismate-binding protein [Pseudonocardia alni]